MLFPPAISDEKIIACLRQEFGQRIERLDFLPLGADMGTAVYRATAADGMPYFCKLRSGNFNETSVEMPRFLSQQGVAQVIPPLPTLEGGLWAGLEDYHVILYPFIEGVDGYTQELSEPQWAEFATALQRLHAARPPAELAAKIPVETYAPEWRERCRQSLRRLEAETFTDPVMRSLAGYLLPRRETVHELIRRAEHLAQVLLAQPAENVPCHADMHPGNLHIHPSGRLFIVDWDDVIYAPKERDLMFIGGGQGFLNRTAQEEESLFYRYYGPVEIDPFALAYFRCERALIDIAVECEHIFEGTLAEEDRAQSLQFLHWGFEPNAAIEMALQTAWPG